MNGFALFIHISACVLLIILVLLQSGKGSATGVFGGGGGADNLFPAASGTSFIKKLTLGLAIAIAVTSLMLSVFSGRASMKSVVDRVQLPQQPAPAAAPAAPAQPAAPAAQAAQTPAPAPAK